MKKLLLTLQVVLISLLSVMPLYAQKNSKARDRQLDISLELRNLFTGAVVQDTLTGDLLLPDSSLLMSHQLKIYGKEPYQSNRLGFSLRSSSRDFIIRVKHPDYETTYYPVHLKDNFYYNTVNIRRLTAREKKRLQGILLDEVTVTASVVQIINKGDTLQFNADAFELAEGSMLGALVEQLPGVELRDNGQIFVNGRFVSKLLLNGKDFFSGDKMVLLQNLPAYTVKNIQVYQQKTIDELARKGSAEPDLVMDVNLKKEFNAGWLANAEAAGGTHSRYRLRGFGLMYTGRSRIAAYALANNLNETGMPNMSGAWRNPFNNRNLITTKGAGLDYHLEPDNRSYLYGTASFQYQNVQDNTLTNRENYIPQGDNTYLRRWYDSRQGNLSLTTRHQAQFDKRQWLSENDRHQIDFNFQYGSRRNRSNTTEGTFMQNPADNPSLRNELQNGMPDTLDILNRYLSLFLTDGKSVGSDLAYELRLTYGSNAILIKFAGSLGHDWSAADQQYLLQYADATPQSTKRTNPRSEHSYSYRGRVFAFLEPFGADSYFHFWPSYEVKNSYKNSSNVYYDMLPDSITGEYDRRRALERWERYAGMIDQSNSYDYTLHHLMQKVEMIWLFEKRVPDENGYDLSRVQVNISPSLEYSRRGMIFRGYNRQALNKNKLLPGVDASFHITPYHARQRIDLRYHFSTSEPEMMDMIDVHFSSDPLNLTMGNPHLQTSFTHKIELNYQPLKPLAERLWVWFQSNYSFRQNSVAYGTAYDLATGVRTTRPMNVNGNREGSFILSWRVMPDKTKKFSITNVTNFSPSRYVTFVSDNLTDGMKKSVSHRNDWWDQLTAEYTHSRFNIALTGDVSVNHVTSSTGDFEPYTLTTFRYGVRGLVKLPWNIELSTNLRMYCWRGYSDPSQNTDKLIWNARISKSLLKGALLLALDGYDMLCQSRTLQCDITSSYRQETRYNYIPNYFMFSVSYNFAKKPRK